MLREVLVGPPEHFHWLPTSAISKAALASGITLSAPRATSLAAHAEMVSAYEDAGVTVHTLPADPALPYQVFSRDSSVWGSTARSSPSCTSPGAAASTRPCWTSTRRPGIAVAHKDHRRRRWRAATWCCPPPAPALIGYCEERTEEPAARQLAGWLDEQGWQVRAAALRPALRAHRRDRQRGRARAGRDLRRGRAARPPGLAAGAGPGADRGVATATAMALGANAMCLGEDRVRVHRRRGRR